MCDFNGDCGCMGGADFPMNNGFNTNGVGDAVCPTNHSYGSGDMFYGGFVGYPYTKKGVGSSHTQNNKKKKKNDGYTQFGYGSMSAGSVDMSPRPLYVPFGKK